MLSPAVSPLVQRQSKSNKDDGTANKENTFRNPICSPRIGLSERVLQPSSLSKYSSRDTKLCDIREEDQTRKQCFDDSKSCECENLLPQKRRFSDSMRSSRLLDSGDDTVNDAKKRVKKPESRWDEGSQAHGHSATVGTRVNPFDKPLKQVAQVSAPIRSYRAKAGKPGYTKAITDPPPRALVSYEDLWDGVSCVEKDAKDQWDDYGYCATYDFLYDGVWTRCVGKFVIPVEKEVKDLSMMDGYSCSGRRKRFRDLDHPAPFNVVRET